MPDTTAVPSRQELEADPLFVAFLAAYTGAIREVDGDDHAAAYTPDLDDDDDRQQLAAMIRHLRAQGVGLTPYALTVDSMAQALAQNPATAAWDTLDDVMRADYRASAHTLLERARYIQDQHTAEQGSAWATFRQDDEPATVRTPR